MTRTPRFPPTDLATNPARLRRSLSGSMMALVLSLGVLVLIAGLLMVDHARVNRRRAVERGFLIVSARASQRLQFRPPKRSDRDFYLEMASDPVAAEANGWSGGEVAAVQKRFGDRKLFAVYQGSELVAFQRTTGTAVGTATFAPSPLDQNNARSIGVHVHADHRRKGYGREIMAAAILLLQYEPGPIHVGTLVSNVGMQKIMADLGYRVESGTRPYLAPNGKTYDGYWYYCGPETHPPHGLFET